MEKNKKFETVPVFSNEQIEMQLEKSVKFLETIYPWLKDNGYHKGAIELRAIKRDTHAKYIKSFNTWRMEKKDKDRLRNFLKKINGQGYCIYYSVFAFNYDLENENKQKGKINNGNALFTTILAMDFDDISEAEFEQEKIKLDKLGIETIDIYTGHGFQSIVLLSEEVHDKDILRKFTKLLRKKGFKVDEAIVDAARVMRKPFTFNCKSLDSKNKYYGEGEIIPVKVVRDTKKRYTLAEVFKKLNTLETIIYDDAIQMEFDFNTIKTVPINYEAKEEKKVKENEIKEIKIENLKTLYSVYIDVERLPEAIQKMLQGSQEGLRNKVLLFIIPFFRNSLGLNIKTIKDILKIWGSCCSPSLEEEFIDKEVNRLYKYQFKALYGQYTEELKKAYGYLEFDKFTKDNKILIPNEIFTDYKILSGGAVKVYLAMKLSNKIDQIKNFEKQDIQQITNICERTLERNIKDLVNLGYVCKRRSNRRLGEKYEYYINPYFNKTAGFTMIDNSTVKLMLEDLTVGEIKLYTYLSMMVGSSKSDCWASQEYLSTKINKTQQGISLLTDNLTKRKYITKKTIESENIKHCIYNLNY